MANPILAEGSTVGATGTITGTAGTFIVLSLILTANVGVNNANACVTVTMTNSYGGATPCGSLTPDNPRLKLEGAGTFVVTRAAGNCGVDSN